MRFSFFLASGLLLAAGELHGQQEPYDLRVVRGEIVSDSGFVPTGLMVEVRDVGRPRSSGRVLVMNDGSFELPRMEEGHYEASIMNAQGEILQQGFVRIWPHAGPLLLRFRPQKTLSPPTGTISLRRLLRPVPRKAVREFQPSHEGLQAGDTRKSIQHLEKAIRIYPDYAEAHNNLGVRYMALDQNEKATEEFQKTITLDPESAKGHLNLSLALSSFERYPEAERAARRAVQLDRNSVAARYALGQILAAQDKNTPEALENLRKAAEEYPRSRLLLARLLVRRGETSVDLTELRKYRSPANPEKRHEAESWLRRLTQGRTP